MKIFLLGVLASLIFFSTTALASPQSSSPDAQLKGSLLDASGAGVGGVQVVAQLANDPQSHLWKATSTTDGVYTLTLPPGNYHVVFQRKPFAAREFDLALTAAGEMRTLDLRLDLERLSSSVVVTA
jgi:Carboxypeptidase regulatory-like domain